MALQVAEGHVLVATRALGDPNFARTVVLLCRHEAESGSFGLILNRPTSITLAKALPNVPLARRREEPLWMGGPVDGQALWIVHRRRDLPDPGPELLDGIHLSVEPGILDRLLTSTPPDPTGAIFRPYVGYAGWDAGQLEVEIQEGAWGIVPVGPEVLFSPRPSRLWHGMRARALLGYGRTPGVIDRAGSN